MENISSNNEFLVEIQSMYPSLTKNEKKVADTILKEAKQARFMSINELADMSGVGLTSVSRFCNSMNLKGFQEFKKKLSLSMSTGDTNTLPADVTIDDPMAKLFQKVFKNHTHALQETYLLLNSADILKATEYIVQSDQIRFFGVGASNITALEGMHKFLNIMPNVYALSDTLMQLMAASSLNENDVAIIISNAGNNNEIVEIAKKAKKNGAKTICITRYAKSNLVEYADIVLLCGGYDKTPRGGYSPSKSAQSMLLDILYTHVYRERVDYSNKISNAIIETIKDKSC